MQIHRPWIRLRAKKWDWNKMKGNPAGKFPRLFVDKDFRRNYESGDGRKKDNLVDNKGSSQTEDLVSCAIASHRTKASARNFLESYVCLSRGYKWLWAMCALSTMILHEIIGKGGKLKTEKRAIQSSRFALGLIFFAYIQV